MPGIKILPNALQTEQQHRLGIREPDRWGDLWTYVEVPAGTYEEGQIFRDALSSDLISNSGIGTVTAPAEKGSRTLQDTGEFANKPYLVGAIGEIFEGPGQGQRFIVEGVRDNALTISINGNGWETALTTASKYKLFLPGRIVLSSGSHAFMRGVLHRKGFTVPAGEVRYCWLKQTGNLRVKKDNDGGPFVINRGVTTLNGLAVGTGAAPAVIDVGTPIFGEPSGAADVLTEIKSLIDNGLLSSRMPVAREQGYTDNYGNPIKI